MIFTEEHLAGQPDRIRRAYELAGARFNGQQSGKELRGFCPFHDDQRASMDVNMGSGLFICRVCSQGGDVVNFMIRRNSLRPEEAIAQLRRGLGLGNGNGAAPPTKSARPARPATKPASVVAPPELPPPTTERPTSERRYEIRSAEGKLVAVHVRRDFADGLKRFAWERDGKPGLAGLPVAELPLYGAERVASWAPSTPVILCEGEKAADALLAHDFHAAGTVTGAGPTPASRPLEVLCGRPVVLWPDNDEPGRKHMENVAAAVRGTAASISVLSWGERPKDDAADFFARGGTTEQLDRLLAEAQEVATAVAVDEPSAPTPANRQSGVTEIRMLRAADVTEEKVEWLWGSRIPKRYLTLISGDPGTGKSHIAIDLAARLSTGSGWPDSGVPEPGATLFVNSEDGHADVLRPRLRVAGADLNRIGFLVGKFKPEQPTVELLLTLKEDLATLEAQLPAWQELLGLPIRLLAIDPFMNHLGRVDPNREGEVRPLMAELASFLRRTNLAMLGIRHLNKAQERSLLYRGGGSMAFTGAARAEYFVGEDPNDPELRVFARVKGNLSLEPAALAYQIVESETDPGISKIKWKGPSSYRAEDVIAGSRESNGGSQTERAEKMLTELLGEGQEVPSEEVFIKADELKIGHKSVNTASRRLGVLKRPRGFGGGWVWSLTEKGTA